MTHLKQIIDIRDYKKAFSDAVTVYNHSWVHSSTGQAPTNYISQTLTNNSMLEPWQIRRNNLKTISNSAIDKRMEKAKHDFPLNSYVRIQSKRRPFTKISTVPYWSQRKYIIAGYKRPLREGLKKWTSGRVSKGQLLPIFQL